MSLGTMALMLVNRPLVSQLIIAGSVGTTKPSHEMEAVVDAAQPPPL